MTIDQLNKLTDEEVRVRVARAMGWRFADKPFRGARRWLSPDGKWLLKPWDYPADLNAAFTLVEKLKSDGWGVHIYRNPPDKWRIDLKRYAEDQWPFIEHPSLARVICLSFLAVTEKEEG